MRGRTILAALACSAVVAACGGSGSHKTASKSTPYGPKSSPYAVSRCMRANGVTNFPDPSQGSGGVGFPGGLTESSTGELTVDGVSFSGPALKRAEKVCREFLPGGAGPRPTLTAQQKRQLLALARCMRAHGVPSFPDPGSSPPQAPVNKQQVTLPGSGTPAFNHAIQVCGRGGGQRFRVVGSNVQGP